MHNAYSGVVTVIPNVTDANRPTIETTDVITNALAKAVGEVIITEDCEIRSGVTLALPYGTEENYKRLEVHTY